MKVVGRPALFYIHLMRPILAMAVPHDDSAMIIIMCTIIILLCIAPRGENSTLDKFFWKL